VGVELDTSIRVRPKPDVLKDLLRLAGVELKVAIDGGANVGQTAAAILRTAPHAHVHCFEPVSSTFAELQRNVGEDPRVTLNNAALSQFTGMGHVTATPLGTANNVEERPSNKTEPCHLWAGDEYLTAMNVDRVDLLKLDVEGHELQALRGFIDSLLEARFALIQLELGFYGVKRMRSSFRELSAFLETFGYRVLRFVDQVGKPLEFADVVFMRMKK
jgi:FkbM family methyltransferase